MKAQPPIPTAFAPAERADPDDLLRSSEDLGKLAVLQELYDALDSMVLILNRRRQIVFANRRLLEVLGADSLDAVLGKRSGEAFDCIHACEAKGGCGTTEFCSKCGAVNAILESQAGGRKVIKECRMLRTGGREALDIKVCASPLTVGSQTYTIFAIEDISDTKRRRVLERIFFHDITNTAVGVRALSELLPTVPEPEVPEVGRMIHSSASTLVLEIGSQRDLAAMEHNELVPKVAPVAVAELFRTLEALYKNHDAARGKRLIFRPADPPASMETDAGLLGRVLGNMIKNALEASAPGDSVTIGCERLNARDVRFSVHNPAVMPRDVQLQVFQRSFSTKGEGRGLGTYSIKLITERYLHGSAGFTSREGEGTVFYVVLPPAPAPAA